LWIWGPVQIDLDGPVLKIRAIRPGLSCCRQQDPCHFLQHLGVSICRIDLLRGQRARKLGEQTQAKQKKKTDSRHFAAPVIYLSTGATKPSPLSR